MVIRTSRERLSERDRWQEGRSTSLWGRVKREPFNTREASQAQGSHGGGGEEGVGRPEHFIPVLGLVWSTFFSGLPLLPIMLSAPEERATLAVQKDSMF